jgi:hypothetical protein
MADLELSVGVGGVDQAVTDLQKVKDAQKSVSDTAVASGRATAQAGAQASRGLRDAGQTAQQLGQSVSTAAQRLQGMSSAVAALAGQIGARGAQQGASLIASMGGFIAQGAAMGSMFGPTGTVIGALAGAASAVASLAGEHRSAAEAARDQATATAELIAQMREQTRAYNVQFAAREGTLGRLALTDFDDAGLQAQSRDSRAAISPLEARRRAIENEGSIVTLGGERVAVDRGEDDRRRREAALAAVDAEIADARARIGAIDAEIARRRDEADAVGAAGRARAGAALVAEREREAEREAERGARRGRGLSDDDAIANEWAAAVERRRAHNEEMERLADAEKAREEALVAVEIELGAAKRQAAEEGRELQVEAAREAAELRQRELEQIREHHRELADAAKEASAAFRDGWTTSLDDVADRWREANVALRAAGQQQIGMGRLMERSMVAIGNNIAETVGGTMVGAFKSAVSAWVDGSKTFVEAAEDMAKGVIQALVVEAIVQGVVEIARGIADMASYQYATGAQHFAAAAAWAAVGGVAGAVGGAIGAFGGGGGGAGKDAAGGTDQRGLADRSLGEGDADRSIVVIVQPGWANAREQQRFVYGSLAAGARSGMRVDSTALRGRR